VSLHLLNSDRAKSGFRTPVILQSAQADFVCIEAVSTAELLLQTQSTLTAREPDRFALRNQQAYSQEWQIERY
jgi:hypothetical protein